jgi:sugar lactone lactonase YvrE
VGAQFNIQCCGGIAVDPEGILYIADTVNNRVRQVSSGGIMTTIAGTGAQGYSGHGTPAVEAQLARPQALATSSAGDLYIGDTYNFRVRKISREGIITTVAGNGTLGHSGDGGPAASAQIGYVFDMALDAASNLYWAEIGSVRKFSPEGIITTVLDFSGNARPGGLPGATCWRWRLPAPATSTQPTMSITAS